MPHLRKSLRKSPIKKSSSKMNLLNFSKNELLENLTITETNQYPIHIKLYNAIIITYK